MFVRWPDKVKALRDDDTLASIIDIAPTILKMAGAPVPNDLTGLDLTDRQAMANRKSVFVEAYTHDIADLKQPLLSLTARVVIHGNYKLILPGPARPDRPFATTPEHIELHDLKNDPLEKPTSPRSFPTRSRGSKRFRAASGILQMEDYQVRVSPQPTRSCERHMTSRFHLALGLAFAD
jgi:arylsulfatase A-like enzyme